MADLCVAWPVLFYSLLFQTSGLTVRVSGLVQPVPPGHSCSSRGRKGHADGWWPIQIAKDGAGPDTGVCDI